MSSPYTQHVMNALYEDSAYIEREIARMQARIALHEATLSEMNDALAELEELRTNTEEE